MQLKRFPHYKQLNATDCGPTSLRMITKYYGLNYSAEMLRRHCFISRRGVTMQGIAECAQHIGFDTIGMKMTFGQLQQKGCFLAYYIGTKIILWYATIFKTARMANTKSVSLTLPRSA